MEGPLLPPPSTPRPCLQLLLPPRATATLRALSCASKAACSGWGRVGRGSAGGRAGEGLSVALGFTPAPLGRLRALRGLQSELYWPQRVGEGSTQFHTLLGAEEPPRAAQGPSLPAPRVRPPQPPGSDAQVGVVSGLESPPAAPACATFTNAVKALGLGVLVSLYK